ncbi:hypothetical protein [Synechococcus sp. PCC 7336]|uniref:hypothetical protein n=1 Tax=Synechococcus sp. PCC 7336 TaxID=195250 RepID=UPI00037B5FD7|nr:hypothetical protein [Synechococcus sp. PCC 7336]
MPVNIATQDLEIVLISPNHSPATLTLDLLFRHGIISADWKLKHPAKHNHQFSHLIFSNGIDIISEPGKIAFSEALNHEKTTNLEILKTIHKYIESFPEIDYMAVKINPRLFVTFNSENEDSARDFIIDNLLANASWLKLGKAPVRADLALFYSFEESQLKLNINEAILSLGSHSPKPAILISGNFMYKITEGTYQQMRSSLFQSVRNWERDLENYRSVVRELLGTDINL